MKKVFSLVIFIIAMTFLFTSCDVITDIINGVTDEKYTVSFECGEGATIEPIQVKGGKAATNLPVPKRDGYTFGGWYKDAGLTTPWAEGDTVSEDITLYAKWNKVITPPVIVVPDITITFVTNGGSPIEPVKMKIGTVSRPADPERDGYTFEGWYADESFTTQWDFSTPVAADTTLYAKWKKTVVEEPPVTPDVTVTFEANGGTEIKPVTMKVGTVSRPADPEKAGYTFAGWYKDADLTLEWSFASTVTEDITLYAKWTPVQSGGTDGPDNPSIGDVELGAVQFTLVGASFETAYCQWNKIEGADGYAVYCDGNKVDSQLIRCYGEYYRCDVLGLTAEEHTIRVMPVKDGLEFDQLASEFKATPMAHIREGFAFVGGDANGAYNADGTLKENAVVIYVTNENKDTISLSMKTDKNKTETKVGIQNILLGLKKGYYQNPLCIRFIGNITDPSVLQNGDLKLDINDGAFSKGLTIEGVGNDATFNGFGLCVKGAKNVEIRNLGFMNCDSGEGDNISLQQDNSHIWVHNCDLFYGDAGADADQAKGDGALDIKRSTNITISFNHYFDSGKCNLQGMKDETVENCITYHHNWYDHSDSRHPRVRTCTVHVYNNYYDGVAKYGIGATMGSSVFAENNYFRNTNRPMSISMQGLDSGTFSSEDGGIIKAFGNVIDGLAGKELITYSANKTSFDYYDAKTRDEIVPTTVKALKGGSTYNNFDTAADMYSYNVQSAEDARDTVIKYAGRVQGGDFKWTFTSADDTDYNVNSALKATLKNYTCGLVISDGNGGSSGSNNGGSGNPDTGDGDNTTGGTTPPPAIEGSIVHNFTTDGKDSEFFNITGNLSSEKGSIVFNGLTLTQCLKMESSTSIIFTVAEDCTITLVLGGSGSKDDWRVDIDGVDHPNIEPDGVTDYKLCIVELKAGTHEITKKKTTNLYYIIIE